MKITSYLMRITRPMLELEERLLGTEATLLVLGLKIHRVE